MKHKTSMLASATALVCCLLAASAALAQGPDIDWWVIASGGGPSSGTGVILNDTLGQPVIGPASSGNVSLGAGYWYGAGPPTGVTLTGFTATSQEAAIVLAWETALEVDVLGFHVYRAASLAEPPTRLNSSLIPATGGPAYTYRDGMAVSGIPYHYWLEVVDTGGGATRHGPVTATVVEPGGQYHIYLPLASK